MLFPAFTRTARIDGKKVKWISVAPSQKIPMLLAGKVDGATFYALLDPVLAMTTAKLGGYNKILYADHGLDFYSNGLATTDGFIEENPGTLRDFVQASVKAYRYTFAHPDEAAKIMAKHQPHLNERFIRATIDAIRGIILTPAAKANGIGYMTKEKMRRTRDIILSAYGKKGQVPLQDIYTNRFLK